MLNTLLNQILIYIKAEVPEFNGKNVERYQNQFETNSTYTFGNAVAVCFVELLEANPISKDAQKDSINKSYTFRALIGRDFEAAELCEKVFDLLDTADTEVGDRIYEFTSVRMFLVGWFGRVAVYELQFIAE